METLQIKDFEMQFLNLLGFKYQDNTFVYSDNRGLFLEYYSNCSKILKPYKNMTEEEFKSQKTKCKYQYSDGYNTVIEFIRGSDGDEVKIYYDGYEYWAKEGYEDNYTRTRIVGINSWGYNIENDWVERNTFNFPKEPAYWSMVRAMGWIKSKYVFGTHVMIEKDHSRKYIEKELICSPEKIYLNAKYSCDGPQYIEKVESDKTLKLTKENYAKAMRSMIEDMFAENNRFGRFYELTIPFLYEAFESSLTLPYIYKAFETLTGIPMKDRATIDRQFDAREKRIQDDYTGEERENKLKELNRMKQFLNSYYSTEEQIMDSSIHGSMEKKPKNN